MPVRWRISEYAWRRLTYQIRTRPAEMTNSRVSVSRSPNERFQKEMKEGEIIGKAEDISQKYLSIIPHVHFQIDKIDPEILIHIYQLLRGRS